MSEFEIVVIGAGIAGASLAAELSSNARVLLLEMESQPGYHTTGRSAAIYSQTYGPPAIRALTRASGGFFYAPPEGFCGAPLLTPRKVIMVARQDQRASLDELLSQLTSDDDSSCWTEFNLSKWCRYSAGLCRCWNVGQQFHGY